MKTSDYPHYQCPFPAFNVAQAAVVPWLDKDVNVVVAFNTAVGKTALAECAFGYHLKQPASKVVYISPFKGISDEKYRQWKADPVFAPCGVLLNTGDVRHVARTEYDKNRFLIFTAEAFDVRTRSPVHYDWLRRVACLAYDEAHLISTDRGGKMEAALIRFTAMNPDCRLLALSATMSNGMDLARWLKALNGKTTKFVESDWRPCPIHYDFHMLDGRAASGSLVAKAVELARRSATDKTILFVHSKKVGQQLVYALRNAGIPTAFHNASLPARKRAKLEKDFDDPVSGLDVLVSTSTLSAGVNIGG